MRRRVAFGREEIPWRGSDLGAGELGMEGDQEGRVGYLQ